MQPSKISWDYPFKEAEWKYFCRFVFVCFTLKYNFMNKLLFNNCKKKFTTNNSTTVQIFYNLLNDPISVHLFNLVRRIESFVGLFYIIINICFTLYIRRVIQNFFPNFWKKKILTKWDNFCETACMLEKFLCTYFAQGLL